MLKFAVLCPHYHYIKRGTENMTKDINRILMLRGHKVDVFGLGNDSDKVIPGLTKQSGLGKYSNWIIEKSYLGGLSRKFIGLNPNLEDIVFSWNAKLYLETLVDNYDLLWSNGEFWCANLLTKFKKKYNKPNLIFFGGGISKMMLREAKMLPDIFVVLTPQMKHWIQSKVSRCNVKCIPSGVRLTLFQPYAKPLYDPLKYEHPIVVSTSALIESKRVDLTIKAMAKLGKGTLFVTNNGPLREDIIKLGRKLLGSRFHYLGLLPFENLPRLYTFADVMCMPSRNEPYGAVLFEAMACNTPVVAGFDPVREWMVGNGGVLVDNCKKIENCVEGIKLAYETDFDKKPRAQAEKFSWTRTVNGYEKAIKEVIQ